ncbi:MAG: hypothetical protein ACP5GD_01880 [Candidatus Micrarchaeia archaeon]|jgi:hypothetical protein
MEAYLKSSIKLPAKMEASLAEVQAILSNYPNLKFVGRGSTLKYMIDGNETGHFFLLSISEEEIVFDIFSTISPLYFLNESLSKLFALLEGISQLCTVDLSNLLPYLIMALSKSHIEERFLSNSGRGCSGGDAARLLARRIILLEKELESERLARRKAEEFLRKAILQLVIRRSSKQSVEDLASAVGLERKQIESMIAELPSYGYRAIWLDKDTFEVVEA